MKTNQERIQSINKKVQDKKTQRSVWTACISVVCIFAIAITVCSVPILGGGGVPNINAYQNDAYYPLISGINGYLYQERPKTSVFQTLAGKLKPSFDAALDGDLATPEGEGSGVPTSPGAVGDGSAATPVPDGNSSDSNNYQETTLNQVKGVIEGDILKRSSKNVFYLRETYVQSKDGKDEACLSLDVYDLNKGDTQLIATYNIKSAGNVAFNNGYYYGYTDEMYLSDDAKTLTVLAQGVAKADGVYGKSYVIVITLNVSDPSNITEIGRKYVSGKYLSSRKVDGQILVVTNFLAYASSIDYSDKSTFVPSCGSNLADYIPMQSITLPRDITDCNYTVIAQIDEKTQTVNSQYALFSYSSDIYVSQNNLFAYRSKICPLGSNEYYDYYKNPENRKGQVTTRFVTEITQLSYKNGIEKVSQFCVDGYAKDQYSFDEKDGVLRIITTTQQTTRYYPDSDGYYYDVIDGWSSDTSASLYCVDLSTQNVIGKVEQFAPKGETVRSVRFDGDTAYVCTAIQITDPVFAFDLSDYNNITVKDTGVISGFSVSLIPFGDVLLGIGTGSSSSLKIEAYKVTDTAVTSAGVYEYNACSYSSDYKAHFVDANRQLVGLQIYQYRYVSDSPNDTLDKYILLKYDSETQSFTEVAVAPFGGEDSNYYYNSTSFARAFYCDDGVYVFNRGNHLFIDLAE